jgi:hypothetical protein
VHEFLGPQCTSARATLLWNSALVFGAKGNLFSDASEKFHGGIVHEFPGPKLIYFRTLMRSCAMPQRNRVHQCQDAI